MKEGVNRNQSLNGGGSSFSFENIDVIQNEQNIIYDFGTGTEEFFRIPFFNTEENRWENVSFEKFAKNLKSANSSLIVGTQTGGIFEVPQNVYSVIVNENSNVIQINFDKLTLDNNKFIEVINLSTNVIEINIVENNVTETIFTLQTSDRNFGKVKPNQIKIAIFNDRYIEFRPQLSADFFEDFDNKIDQGFFENQTMIDSDNFLKIPVYYAEESRFSFLTGVDFGTTIERILNKGKGTLIVQNNTFNPFDFDTIIIPQNYPHTDLIVDVEILDSISQLNTKILKFIVVKETAITLKIRRSGVLEVVTELQNDFSPDLKQLQMIFYANGLRNLF